MNPFISLVPPDMDVTCSYQYVGSSTLQIGTTTCSDPWNYYKGYGFDIVTVVVTVTIVAITLIGYRYK